MASQFKLEPESEEPTWYESSPGAKRAFCSKCGSPMFFQSTRWPDEMHIARAFITEPLDREPSVHVFYENHVPWLNVNDELPKKVSTSSNQPVGQGQGIQAQPEGDA